MTSMIVYSVQQTRLFALGSVCFPTSIKETKRFVTKQRYLFPFDKINVHSFFLSLLIREYCKTWYHLLVAKLLYCNPAIKSFDLQYHTQVNMHHNMISRSFRQF